MQETLEEVPVHVATPGGSGEVQCQMLEDSPCRLLSLEAVLSCSTRHLKNCQCILPPLEAVQWERHWKK